MVKNIKNEVNSSKENQLYTISTVGTKYNTRKGKITMNTKQDINFEVNLVRTNNKNKGNQMNILTQEQIETEILKLEVKKILRDDYILFTEDQFGIYINMTNIPYRILFSENPSMYRIYAGDLEIRNSYLKVENQFETLHDTIMDINIFFDDVLPFNVYANNGEVA